MSPGTHTAKIHWVPHTGVWVPHPLLYELYLWITHTIKWGLSYISYFQSLTYKSWTTLSRWQSQNLILKSELIDLPVLPFSPFFQGIIKIKFSSLWAKFDSHQFVLDINCQTISQWSLDVILNWKAHFIAGSVYSRCQGKLNKCEWECWLGARAPTYNHLGTVLQPPLSLRGSILLKPCQS